MWFGTVKGLSRVLRSGKEPWCRLTVGQVLGLNYYWVFLLHNGIGILIYKTYSQSVDCCYYNGSSIIGSTASCNVYKEGLARGEGGGSCPLSWFFLNVLRAVEACVGTACDVCNIAQSLAVSGAAQRCARPIVTSSWRHTYTDAVWWCARGEGVSGTVRKGRAKEARWFILAGRLAVTHFPVTGLSRADFRPRLYDGKVLSGVSYYNISVFRFVAGGKETLEN